MAFEDAYDGVFLNRSNTAVDFRKLFFDPLLSADFNAFPGFTLNRSLFSCFALNQVKTLCE